MATHKFICPNPQCQNQLKREQPVAGKKIACPKCGTALRMGPSVDDEDDAPSPSADTFGLAPESEERCPKCKAIVDKDAVVCGACGRKFASTSKPKPSGKPAKSKSSKKSNEPLTPEEIAYRLDRADKAIENAREELSQPLPLLSDLDLVMFTMRANSRVLAESCAIPYCAKKRKGERGDETSDGVLVTVTCPGMEMTATGGKELTMTLCTPCGNQFKKELAEKQARMRHILEPSYQELQRSRTKNADTKAIDKRIHIMEKLANKILIKLESGVKGCFIATVSFGSPYADEVETLRQYRDQVLNHSRLGQWLVKGYYKVSPTLAALLARTRHGRALVRWMLRPIVWFCARRLECRASVEA